ncbi:MAG TPA: aminotransferase class III-fold pyridoxal phosphate-dependent enzyme [Streptosporangiaceae bacterium]
MFCTVGWSAGLQRAVRTAAGGGVITTQARTSDQAAGQGRQILARWAAENPRSAALHARAVGLLPGGVTHDVRLADPFPLAVSRASGARKWDLDGHELVCYVLGHGALLLGHSHPEVVAAVQEQAARSFHPGACHELESDWAQAIVSLVPSAEQVRFTASGTEASLLALRLARAVTGRRRIVKLAGHFHGWHDQAALGSDPPFDEPDTDGLPAQISSAVEVLPADAALLSRTLAAGDVAAVILEPSGAAWGTVPLPGGFLAAARQAADQTGTVLIYDEVVSGFRWSPGGVQQLAGVLPDLTVLGKIVAGGMPGGAVCGSAGLLARIGARGAGRVAHPGTHNAHPLSAAAGTTTLGLLTSGAAQDRAAGQAAALRAELTAVFERCGVAGRAYGQSSTFHLLFGFSGEPEQLDPVRLKQALPAPLAAALHCGMLTGGVHLFHGSGFVSTEHSDADLERTVAALAATLPALQAAGLA